MTAQGDESPRNAKVIWHFTDGKPGHVNQALGLIEALKTMIEIDVHAIDVAGRSGYFLQWLFRRFPQGRSLPRPDLLIGAGRQTHTAMLAAKRAYRCPAVVLMNPQLPRQWFDQCIIPKHDGVTERTNTILTDGVINRISRSTQQSPAQGLFLIGGPSKHHQWDDAAIIDQVRAILNKDAATHWTLTTSRRTPTSTTTALQALSASNLTVVPCDQTGPDWVKEHLDKAAMVWVSQDSVSMVYEALTAGAAVGLLEVPAVQGHDSRVIAGLQGLADRAWVNSFDQWQTTGTLTPCPVQLNEAQRCAKVVFDKFFAPV